MEHICAHCSNEHIIKFVGKTFMDHVMDTLEPTKCPDYEDILVLSCHIYTKDD